MGPFCNKYTRDLATAYPGVLKKTASLVKAMDISCEGIESDTAKQDWQQASPLIDMAIYNWEPAGPQTWPGYDEPAAIAAFVKAKGIQEPLTQDLLRTKYREA